MKSTLTFRNHQRAQRVDFRLLRRIVESLLLEELQRPEFELGIHLVGERTMIRMNETYLQHAGSTDIITFDYADPERPDWLGGDLFVCLPEARNQARRFRTSWQSELVRYLVHGVLHLCGFDDHAAGDRRKMKAEEGRLLHRLATRFEFKKLNQR